ncbi:RING-7 protein [Coccidioides immitis RMSCC 3703]|uniref:RING-7 protein n=1 Tax=Coccidioides immitis RMSCC 3703 TaxID=454286 RepID=A0A0J8R649_COCIT|nr:RING-7 protein [Coccidioides immitis RMSCC 3703]
MPFSSHSSRSSRSSSSSSHVLLRLICQSLLLLVSFVAAQEAFPTDDSVVTPPLGAPQFFLYTRQFALDPAFLVPLTKSMSDAPPSDFNVTGTLVDVSPENANNLNEDQIALVSCDDSAYPGNQKVKDTLKELISNNPTAGATILYTERDRYHCEYTADMSLPPYPNIFTLTRASIAQELQNKLKSSPTGSSSIVAEDPSPSETGIGAIETGGSSSPLERDRGNNGPTTSVAMIILRIDLHPHDEDEQQLENPDEQPAEDDGRLPPPLRDNRGPGNEPEGTRDRRRRRRSLATYIQSTINAMPPNDASIEQRLEAVRRLRSPQQQEGAQTAATGAIGASSENRRSRRFSTMLLDSFRIHTRRHGEEM